MVHEQRLKPVQLSFHTAHGQRPSIRASFKCLLTRCKGVQDQMSWGRLLPLVVAVADYQAGDFQRGVAWSFRQAANSYK